MPEAKAALSYLDLDLPAMEGEAGAPVRRLIKPMVLAKLIQAAEIGAGDHVLDVGCGTGYSSAVLGRLAKSVVALEQDADLVRIASQALATALGDIELTQGGLIEVRTFDLKTLRPTTSCE